MPRSEHTLLIKGDFKDFETKFKGLSDKLEAFSRKELGVNLKTESLDIFKTKSTEVIGNLKTMQQATKKAIDELAASLKTAKSPQEIDKLNKHLIVTKRFARQIGKEIQTWEVAEKGKQFSGMLQKMTSGMGGIARLGAGGGMGGGAGMGLLTKLGVAGAIAAIPLALYAGASMLGGPRRGIAGQNMQIMGLGGPTSRRGLEGLREAGIGQGFGAQETLAAAAQGLRTMGPELGRAGTMGRFAQFARGTGMELGETMQIGGAFRQQGLRGQQIARQMEEIYARATAQGFDKSRALNFLQMTAQATSAMAQSGSANIAGTTGIVEALARKSGFFKETPARGFAALTGMTAAFTASSGPNQMLALRALKRMPGAGSKSMADLLWRQRFGFGEAVPGEKGRTAVGLGNQFLRTITEAGAGGMSLEQIRSANPEEREQRTRMGAIRMQETLGVSMSLADQLVRAMVKNPEAQESKDLQQKIKDEMEKNKKTTGDIVESIDGQVKVQEAMLEELKLDLGDAMVPLTVMINKGIWTMVKLLGKLPFMGEIGAVAQEAEDKMTQMTLATARRKLEKDQALTVEEAETLGETGAGEFQQAWRKTQKARVGALATHEWHARGRGRELTKEERTAASKEYEAAKANLATVFEKVTAPLREGIADIINNNKELSESQKETISTLREQIRQIKAALPKGGMDARNPAFNIDRPAGNNG